MVINLEKCYEFFNFALIKLNHWLKQLLGLAEEARGQKNVMKTLLTCDKSG